MTVLLQQNPSPSIDQLVYWRDPQRSVPTEPMDTLEAVRRFRLHEVDIISPCGDGQWIGYKLKRDMSTYADTARRLTTERYALTLQRSIA